MSLTKRKHSEFNEYLSVTGKDVLFQIYAYLGFILE